LRLWFQMGWIATALTSAAWAQDASLTLSDCVQKALDARNELTIARNDLRVAQQGVVGARAGFLPQVQATGGYTYNSPSKTPGSQQFIALNGVHEYLTQFGASLPLDTSGKLRAELARARSEREAARQSVRLTERDLRKAVTASYYRLVLARRLVEVAKSTLAEAQSFESRTRKLNAGGEAARADRRQGSGRGGVPATDVAGRGARRRDRQPRSCFVLDRGRDRRSEGVRSIRRSPAPACADGTSDAYLKRLEFSVFDAQRLGLKADIGAARAGMLPQTSLNWQYGIDSTRYSWADRGQAFFATVDVPIFDWLKAWSATKQAHIRLESFDITRDMARRNLSKEYQSALARVRLTWAQIETTRQQVSLSQENYHLSQVKYEGGEGLALDVVAAQSQLAQARGNYFSAIAAYFNARSDLEVASGQ